MMSIRVVAPALLLLVACGSEPPVFSSVTVTPSELAPGAEATVTVSIENFTLRDPALAAGHALVPLHSDGETEDGEYPDGGHYHIYFDSTDVNPMAVDCPDYCDHGAFKPVAHVTIPDDAQPGPHTLIARLNNDGHMTLKPEIRGEATVMVTQRN